MNDKGCYLLRTREFKNLNDNIYKIGRSINLNKRIKNYPNNSELILKLNTLKLRMYKFPMVCKLKQLIH